MQALHQLFNLRGARWNLLNSANIVLLPKKDGANRPAKIRYIVLPKYIAVTQTNHNMAQLTC